MQRVTDTDMKNDSVKAICDIIQTACLVAVTCSVIWFLWSIAPAVMIMFE